MPSSGDPMPAPGETFRYCRVCGYEPPDAPWGGDGHSPTFEYCACCGVEFGYGDATGVAVDRHRTAWIDAGSPWKSHTVAHDGLETRLRLARIGIDLGE